MCLHMLEVYSKPNNIEAGPANSIKRASAIKFSNLSSTQLEGKNSENWTYVAIKRATSTSGKFLSLLLLKKNK